MNINHIPKELKNLRQWVCWRLEPDKKTDRTTKVPYNPHTGFKASPSTPDTWGTLEEALFCAEKYQFSEGIREKRKQLIEIHWRFLGLSSQILCQKSSQGEPCFLNNVSSSL